MVTAESNGAKVGADLNEIGIRHTWLILTHQNSKPFFMSRYTTVTNILFLKHILKYLYAIYFFKYYSRNKLIGNANDNFRITELYNSYFIDP